MKITITVDGRVIELDVEPRTSLLDALREGCGATSVHAGCEQGACGACTVLVEGGVARSCLLLAVQADGAEVTTVASLGTPERLHPLQEAFRRHHGLQCGFCTPAMVLAAIDLLATNPTPTEHEVRDALSGNLCRCTGYGGIVDAVLEVARTGVRVELPSGRTSSELGT